MRYLCEYCDYVTNKLSNYKLHNLSKKHICAKKRSKNIDDKINSHQIDSQTVKDLMLAKDQMAEELARAREQIAKEREEKLLLQVKSLENQLKMQQEDKASFRKIAETSTESTKSSCDTLNFLMNHFKNASRITDHKLLLDDSDNKRKDEYKDLYKKIGYYARHNRLAQFVVEIIEEVYLSGKPSGHPFCVTDTSRNTYWAHIKDWEKDSKGAKIREHIIKPVLIVLRDEARRFNKDAPKRHENEEDQDEKEVILLDQKGCAEAVSQIQSGVLEDMVLRKLAEVCQLDKKNLHIGKVRHDGPIIEEIIDEN